MTDYQRKNPISFSEDDLKKVREHGILTFRGDYHRSLSSFGTTEISEFRLEHSWTFGTGRFLKSDGVNYWSGNGWTGQPLAVIWDEDTKRLMNLYDAAKNKSGLCEIIYPGMDGMIRFLDMETGEPTRDPINVGMAFKGTCSIHPDYPVLICGSGDWATGPFGEQISARFFLYNLLDGTKLYEFGANDPFAPRAWHGFDSSPIFYAPTDTVICPGENGVLYTVDLNIVYDKDAGTLTVSPEEQVRYVYYSKAAGLRFEASEMSNGSGIENSAVVYDHYLFFGDNGGIFQCLDLNTMQPVWVQDLLEDINSSPVLEQTPDGGLCLYVATTLKYGYNDANIGEACLYKLDAVTGEIIWKKPYEVHTVLGLAGGFLSSGALGEGPVGNAIFYTVSKSPSVDSSYLVSIDRTSGEELWKREFPCDAWSSGCLLYDRDGQAWLVQCFGNGDILLIDAKTGVTKSQVHMGANIESTPAIVGNHLVVGVRDERIIGLRLR
ncbi:MAG: PQQ-like beta-propeller repeat protein [Lachnospiraceae bacterium]|nr:PQQ-like beta-propeller repeat protein [Lachnospiraceae bacterium]